MNSKTVMPLGPLAPGSTACSERIDLWAGADCLADCLGVGAALGALAGADDRVGRDAWGADFDCDRPGDLELAPALSLRPNAGTVNSEPRSTIPVIITTCL
ncbi:MAG: hypothetical protein ACYSUS_06225 [Planctomycetota bacterium]